MVKVASPAGGPILDVATGAGHTAFAFAPHAERVVATDITEGMLAIVREEAALRGLTNIEVQAANAESLPFPENTFEGITCRVAAHHFRNPSAFMSECGRVLRPQGWLLLVDNAGVEDAQANERWNEIETWRDPSHVRNIQPEEWRRHFELHGFSIEHFEVIPKPMNLDSWLERMQVQEPNRSRIREAIMHSEGWLRDYLRPHGDGADAIFHEQEISLLGRRPA
ncbi:MAG: putative methyltransferase YcgJ [Fimbriimonadaceae bacterium]|nr:putative methyltransferase YcgJ [Fimbriimonadaceae bacterium]